MSRRHSATKRKIITDARFNDINVAKFINCLMEDGKKSVAEAIFYSALDTSYKKTGKEPLAFVKEVIDNVRPSVEVRSRRVGGATYQVPVEVRKERSVALAMRWLRDSARKRKEKTMNERLAFEMLDAFNNRGEAIKMRENTHKMAEANKAFSHYRWQF